MTRFELGQRVHVVRDHYGNLIDKPGTVRRLRRADIGAWIELDERDDLHCPFPADDDRGRNIMAYPANCRPEHLAPVPRDPDTVPRPPGCLCTWEQGDSVCPVHPTCANCGVLASACECPPMPGLGSSLDSLPPGHVERIMAALRSALEAFDAERAASAAPHADGCGCSQCHLVSTSRKLLAFHERRVKP